MIVPMKKVALVIQNKAQDEALTKLREVGVLHLERRNISSDAMAKVLERKNRGDNALALIQPYKIPKKKPVPSQSGPQRQAADRRGRRDSDFVDPEKEPYSLDAVNAVERPDLIDLLVTWGKEKKALEDRLAFLDREKKRIQSWGNFDPRAVKDLASEGVIFYIYEIASSIFANLGEDTCYILMGQDKIAVYLLVLDKEIPGFSPLSLPEKSLAEIEAEAAELSVQINAVEERLASFADRMPVLLKDLAEIQSTIEFESARASLEAVEDVPREHALSWVTGFVPQEDVGLLKRAAAENNWALIADDPGYDDEVPTKLKNGKLASLIYPLTGFLEVTPGYNEVDISPWFLMFFVIFFGMIFGDAGYGALLLIAGIVGVLKTLKKGVPPVLKLLLLLAASNFVWGVLTCTWFGVAATDLPVFLQNISLPLISSATSAKSPADEGIVRQNLMIFCFSLALLQLSIGHIIAITRCRTLKLLGELGSIAMLVGMYGIVLSLIASNEYRQIPLLMPCVYLLGGGFVVNFMFVNYDGSVGRSILESCKNIISMILGIANVFSDIMSYIRLWAVGLAGSAISSTVDTMAGPMLGHFIFFVFGIALLVFGHGLNIVLNMLSVLVHGVRLNTLEFSGHAGLTWAGTAYKPFAQVPGDDSKR